MATTNFDDSTIAVAAGCELSTISNNAIPPFDADTHLRSPNMTAEQLEKVAELRVMLEKQKLYHEYHQWCTDAQLQRFLIARLWNLKASHDLVVSALTWRSTRIPVGGVESLPNWEEKMKLENDTGKMYINGMCFRQ